MLSSGDTGKLTGRTAADGATVTKHFHEIPRPEYDLENITIRPDHAIDCNQCCPDCPGSDYVDLGAVDGGDNKDGHAEIVVTVLQSHDRTQRTGHRSERNL